MGNRKFTKEELKLLSEATTELMVRKSKSNLPEIREQAKILASLNFDIARELDKRWDGGK